MPTAGTRDNIREDLIRSRAGYCYPSGGRVDGLRNMTYNTVPVAAYLQYYAVMSMALRESSI